MTNVSGTQNVNFDATYFNGVTGGAEIISTNPLFGVNDWSLIRLNQIGAGRATARFSLYLGSITFEGSTFEGSTFEGSTFEGSTFEGSTFEGSTFEGSTFEGSTFEGSTFEGSTFEGSTFEGSTFEGSTFEGADIDLDTLHGMGRAKPYSLTACVIGTPGCTPAPPGNPLYHRVATGWHNPTEGHVFANHLHRTDLSGEVQGSPIAGVAHNDPEHLPNGVAFEYFVQSEFDDVTPHNFSPNSDPATVTAINDAPIANVDGYNANQDTVLTVAAPGVLGNDTDADSPASSVKAVPPDARLDLRAVPWVGESERGRLVHLHTRCGIHRAGQLHLPGEQRAVDRWHDADESGLRTCDGVDHGARCDSAAGFFDHEGESQPNRCGHRRLHGDVQ